MSKPHVLVVDDRENMVRLLAKVLRRDATVHAAGSGSEAVQTLEKQPVSVVVCDLKMPDMSGLDVLRTCKRLQPAAEFILMTAYASVPTAIEAMREGAYDYVTKPFEPENLRAVVLRALGRATVSNASGPETTDDRNEVLRGLFARSDVMRQLAAQVQRIAARDATALIVGETGTGKELIARAIHTTSPRGHERLVAVNCAAIPAELLESELFGYARGSFTGAQRDRAGLFEQADQGSLFLDEIGEMRLSLQAKLTRAIEERSIRRLGESKERNVNVRLIAATHRDLEAMVRAETFREDLWYRLNVAVVRVPALRDRREDIELLASHFLREIASVPGRGSPSFTDAAREAMNRYEWPGNVRQLRAAVERANIEAVGAQVDLPHLPPEVTTDRTPALNTNLTSMRWHEAMDLGRHETGREYLQAILKRYGGRIADAAAHAGVERESFYRLLRKHGVNPDGSAGIPEA